MSGGFILVFEPQRGQLLREQIPEKEQFTDTFSAEDWEMHSTELCLLSFDGNMFDFACLGSRRQNVATAKFRVVFADFVELGKIPIQDVEARLRAQVRSHFTSAASGAGGRVPEATWMGTLNAIRALRPGVAAELDALIRRRSKTFTHRSPDVEAQLAAEKDNAGVALDIFDPTGELRRQTLEKWKEPERYDPPFVSGLPNVQLRESQMIFHDMGIFPGGERVPSATGTRFVIGDRILDLVYANQTDVETSLGADLIYYNSRFQSYCVVQYKRMYQEDFGGKSTYTYRPSKDKSFAKEMERMSVFCASAGFPLRSDPHDSYRLAGHGFFFKFCPLRFEPASARLLPGMYMPWDYLAHLLAQGATKGPQGGAVLTFENVPRYINNTGFTPMVRDGWIGTRGNATDQITEIVHASLSGRKAVTLAVEGVETKMKQEQPLLSLLYED